jgi:hypothetical protein
MTSAISTTSVSSFATELAALLIQNETTQSDADRASRDAARAAYLEDAQHQIDALHAAADALETGAFASAALSIAGSACSVGATIEKFDAGGCTSDSALLENGGKLCADLAPFANTVTGDVPQKHLEADAKRFETLAEQAKWQASDASSEIDKADRLGAKLLDIVQSLNQAQDSATNAVIGRI